MADPFVGVIIEESLFDKQILKKLKIIKTNVVKVTEKHKTPWLSQWTLHTVEVPAEDVEKTSEEIRLALDKLHNWYADYKTKDTHIIVFRGKIFKIDRKSKEQYNEAKNYGISLGIPAYQVNFYPEIK